MSAAAITVGDVRAVAVIPIDKLLTTLAHIVERGKLAFGIDWSPEAREILRARDTRLAAALEGGETAEEELDRLYEEVRAATAEHDEPRRRRLFARIEALEEAEADRMARYFDEHAPFHPDEARATLDRARELLNHANPAPGDAAR